MKLNKLEFLLMNNPLRGFVQEIYEVKNLREISSVHKIENALELGCGNGYGTKLIKKYFAPQQLIGIDLDDKMLKLATERNTDSTISFKVMDASQLEFPDNYFDAVFDFGIIHHIPNWKDCLTELKRVLKPRGQIILEDLSTESFNRGIGKLWHALLTHPYESMYTTEEFVSYLREIGFEIKNYRQSNPLGLMRHFKLNAINKN